jgi:hypothetical protein
VILSSRLGLLVPFKEPSAFVLFEDQNTKLYNGIDLRNYLFHLYRYLRLSVLLLHHKPWSGYLPKGEDWCLAVGKTWLLRQCENPKKKAGGGFFPRAPFKVRG